MIEITLRNYIKDELLNIPVYMEQPKSLPDEYIILRLMDSGRINHIDAATFSIIVRSTNFIETAQLKDEVKKVLFDAPSIVDCITSASLGGELANTDSANHVYQYELIFNFYYYEEETNNA